MKRKQWVLLPKHMYPNKEGAEKGAAELRKFGHTVEVRRIRIKGDEYWTHGVYLKKGT